MAEAVRFELTDGCPSTVFKTVGLNHSPKPPLCGSWGAVAAKAGRDYGVKQLVFSRAVRAGCGSGLAGRLGLFAAHLRHLAPATVYAHCGERAAPDATRVQRQQLGPVDEA